MLIADDRCFSNGSIPSCIKMGSVIFHLARTSGPMVKATMTSLSGASKILLCGREKTAMSTGYGPA